MADEFGGLETSDVDAGLDVETDVSTDVTSPEVAETPTEVESPDQEQQQGEFHAVKDGRLSAEAKATIDKLKAENPQLAKAVQRALFAEDRLRRELPGGFKEVAQLRQTVEQLGGETGIQEIQGEVNGWREFDQLYTAGDAKVLEFMTETPEAQQAFLTIAPQAFEKFREMHPEGYSSYVSKVFTADMQAEGIPLALERLQDFIADNPKAMEVWQKLAAYVNRIGTFASKDAKLPEMKTAAAGPDPERQKFETEREQFTRTQWKGEAERQHGQIFGDAWKRLASDVPREKVDLVKKLYGLHLQDQLAKRKDFDQNMNRFFAAKQQDGFLKLHKATFAEVVPLAIRAAKLEAGIGSRKAAAAAKGPLTNGNTAPAAPAAPGYQMLPAKPGINTINRNATTPEMWQKHQAILRDGKKVTWK